MIDNTSTNEQPPLQTSLIDMYEKQYRDAVSVIEHDVQELIFNGRDMAGLWLYNENITKISEVHENLKYLYSIIYNNQNVLRHFLSERLLKLGHEPKPICALVNDPNASQEEIENYVLKGFREVGIDKRYWLFSKCFLNEMEYMIMALRILVEPEFVPILTSEGDEPEEESDRYIPSSVKIYVWQRDLGKCVLCGSNEKLEYDHIIPIAKGGSNTARNVQLLCETCNRKKGATIQ